MIIETSQQLMDEYKRRMECRIIHCDNCNITAARHGGHRIFKVSCGHQIMFVPGTHHDTLPAGWSAITCICGKVFPEIEFEDFEFPCKTCEERKNDKRKETI
jgi:hypothetical protein